MSRSVSICNRAHFYLYYVPVNVVQVQPQNEEAVTIPVSSKITLQANQISDKGVVLCPSFFPGSGVMIYQNLYAFSK
jgi:hypothetical protein